ncbi:hypothetical protein HNV26_31965 [Myxococcus xanthus]|nr:hypothetical protein [Myxococcus xanthus]
MAMQESELLLVRNFGGYQKAAERYHLSNRRSFVVGDNEPVVWHWRHHYEQRPVDLLDALKRQLIPISIAVSSGEKEASWATWGNGDAGRPENRWRGVKGGRWKLCHVFPAAPSHLDDSEEAILARFVRNFHPINQFWFASDYNWKSRGRYEMSPKARLGEWPEVCMAFWRAYSARYPQEAVWFQNAARLSERELQAANFASDPLIKFWWRAEPPVPPSSGGTRISPSIAQSATGSENALKKRLDNICSIRETGTGRFHLSQMGKTIGGSERDVPFRFQVVDASGGVIAESSEETARGLGIAERGRRDYDADKYHQTDFMKWECGQGLVPFQALARRVRHWAYY